MPTGATTETALIHYRPVAGHAEQAVAESTHVGPLNTDLLTFRALFSPTLFSSCVERNATLAVNNQIRMSNAGNPKGWGGPPEETWEDPLRLVCGEVRIFLYSAANRN